MADVVSAHAPTLVERLTAEGLISMSAAARMYGEGRPGHQTHKSTATRHVLHGIRLPGGGVLRLEAVRVAGQLRTSRQAVLRFFAAQNADTPTTAAPPANPPRSPAQRSKASARAAAELDALGVK